MTTPIGFDIFARDRASDKFDKVGNSADRTAGKFGRLTTSAGKFAKVGAVAVAAGAGAAGIALFNMTKGAIADEAAQAKLALTLRNSAGATNEQVKGAEAYISKMGQMLGVADDELRPALGRLAVATGDVQQAQSLSMIAMNVSAGTGRSLKSVTEALAKAQNGNVSGLSRLGVATKDAAGKTLSLDKITANLASTYAGQAATAANTTEGKWRRLNVTWDETKEAIGARLIPVATKLGDWFLTKGIPAVSKFAGWMDDKVVPALGRLASWIGANVIPVVTRLASEFMSRVTPAFQATAGFVQAKVIPVLAQIGQVIATKVWPIVRGLADFWWNRWIPAVAAVYISIATKLKPVFDQLVATFQARVLPTVNKLLVKFEEWRPALQKIALTVAKVIGKVAELAATILAKVLPVLIRFSGWILSMVVPALATVIGWLIKVTAKAIDVGVAIGRAGQRFVEFAGKVKNKIGDIIGWFNALPGRILGSLGDLSHLLWDAGVAIISGFIGGLKSKWEEGKAFVSGIGGWVKDHKGPITKDRILLKPAGIAIMEGLISGLDAGKTKLTTALAKVTSYFTRMQQKLKDLFAARNSFAAGFKGFTSSVFGADFTDANTGMSLASPDAMIAWQEQQRQKAVQLQADVQRLMKMGLSPSLIRQLAESGESGAAQIHALAGGSSAQIRQLNQLNAQTQGALGAAGMSAGNALFGGQIREAQANKAAAAAIVRELKRWREHEDKNTQVIIKLEGRTIQMSLLELKRKTGTNLGLT